MRDLCNILLNRFLTTISSLLYVKWQIYSQNAPQPGNTVDWTSILDNTGTLVGIIISIVTGVSIIRGIRYLKTLKEKQYLATFTFWSQINVRIIRIHNLLTENKGLLNNLYPPKARTLWEVSSPPIEIVNEFKNLVCQTLEYLESTTDQMPAYLGWSNDFSEFMSFLTEIVQYDICKDNEYFFNETMMKHPTKGDRDKYWKHTRNLTERLMCGIKDRQTLIEAELYRRNKRKQN